ncbi:hypothetical protein EJB05_51171, partial [Eragrostis curvula]
MDLSGRVLKQVHRTAGWYATSVHLDFICSSNSRTFRLHNLSTGVVYNLPEELTEEHAAEERNTYRFFAAAAFGQARSTGQYKVLRVLVRETSAYTGNFFEIITLGGGSHARWRAKESPPFSVCLDMWKTVVIDGIAYYFCCVDPAVREEEAASDRIASFDLDREEWRPTLRGPLSSSSVDYAPYRPFHRIYPFDLSMSTINGSLVVVHRADRSSLADLWFLMDFERGLWVKQHSIRVQFSDPVPYGLPETVRPLLVLSDGRIVFVQAGDKRVLLRIYDPRTNTYSDVAEIMGRCCAVGLYTGGALGLANGTG